MEYDVVIGLEVHAELKTNSKVFCSCKNEFGAAPNTNCCPVCIGLPGALPVLNKKAVELVIRAGLAMGCQINDIAVFERKNYFYPDLAKAYQISQLVRPICIGGHVDITGKSVSLNRIHLEEDAGKLVHSTQAIGTLIDYNRGGVPLMELVTEPDISSAEEAVEFLTKLRSILIYAGVADCKMEQGGMRCDVNLSVKPKGSKILGERTEMKNLNSFKSVYRAIKFETARQIEVIEKGGVVTRQTRKWNDMKGRSSAMRSKESSSDYRYFPDPDLLAVTIKREDVENIAKLLPMMPDQRRKKYVEEYGIPEYDADVLTREKQDSDFFDEAVNLLNKPKLISNWYMTEIMSKVKETGQGVEISPKQLTDIIRLLEEGKISRTNAKEIFAKVWGTEQKVGDIAKEYIGGVDEKETRALLEKILAANPKAVEDYKTDPQPEKVLRWFVGQVMKETKGKANGQLTEKILKELLQ